MIIINIVVYDKEEYLLEVLTKIPKFVDRVNIIWDQPDCIELEKLRQYFKNNSRYFFKIKLKRDGIGSAIQDGFKLSLKFALQQKAVFIVMAGNGKDNPIQSYRLASELIDKELFYVQGSRYLLEGGTKTLPIERKVINKTLSFLWSMVMRKYVSEVTNGFRAFNKIIFEKNLVDWNKPLISGYEYEYYLNYKLITKYRDKHLEVPVQKIYQNGRKQSKIKFKDGLQILKPLIMCPLNLY